MSWMMKKRTNHTNHPNVVMHWTMRHQRAFMEVMGKRSWGILSMGVNWYMGNGKKWFFWSRLLAREKSREKKAQGWQPTERTTAKKRVLGNKEISKTKYQGLDDDDHMDIDSGDDSDGRNILRGVEGSEEPRVACHGPGNVSMQHFHKPSATVDRWGKKCWEFLCRFCAWYVKNRGIPNHDTYMKTVHAAS